jgi:hypothetical protein
MSFLKKKPLSHLSINMHIHYVTVQMAYTMHYEYKIKKKFLKKVQTGKTENVAGSV